MLNVKPLGRTHVLPEGLWLAYSGAGAEFTFRGSECRITVLGDSGAVPENHDSLVRLAVYLNNVRVVDDLIDAPEKTYILHPDCSDAEATVRIVKLSETAMSTCVIHAIDADEPDGIRPTPPRARKIEFIGDSITCGYGVDDENPEHHFSTATEDATRAYAWRTAEMLGADYSLVSISGYGIISGFTATGEEKLDGLCMPLYYEKFGLCYTNYQERRADLVCWDFASFRPDLIVINLGTNDNSYTGDDPARQEEYRAVYAEFLKMVRRNNPEAVILCTLGMMGDNLYPMVCRAAAACAEETGDQKVFCMPFAVQQPEDGYAADWHPSAATHGKAAEKLAAEIRRLMAWVD